MIIRAPIRTVTEVIALSESEDLERSKDVRIVETFANIFSDIETLRKQFKDILIGCLETNEKIKTSQAAKKLVQCLKKWRTLVEPDFDFSELRAKHPHSVVERLSSVEAKELYAGVVSFLPIALDNVKLAYIYLDRVYKQTTTQIGLGFSDQWSTRSSATSLSRALASTRPNTAVTNTMIDDNNNENGEPIPSQIDPKSRPHTAHSSFKLDIPKSASNPARSNSLATNDLARLDTPGVRSPSAGSVSRRSSGKPKSRVSSSQSIRPQTSSSADWIDIENIDEGLAHGDAEVNPRYSKSSSRNSMRRSLPLSRTPLSTLRQRMRANPREVSAIQEKLKQMRAQSASSVTPGRIRVLSGSWENESKNSYNVPIGSPIANGSAKLDPATSQLSTPIGKSHANSSNANPKFILDVYESSKGKPDISPFPVSGTKKELVESPRKGSTTKRPPASLSARMSQLMARDNKVGSRGSRVESWRAESERSFVASLNKFSSDGKDRETASSSISQSQKLTIPQSKGTDRLWQP